MILNNSWFKEEITRRFGRMKRKNIFKFVRYSTQREIQNFKCLYKRKQRIKSHDLNFYLKKVDKEKQNQFSKRMKLMIITYRFIPDYVYR